MSSFRVKRLKPPQGVVGVNPDTDFAEAMKFINEYNDSQDKLVPRDLYSHDEYFERAMAGEEAHDPSAEDNRPQAPTLSNLEYSARKQFETLHTFGWLNRIRERTIETGLGIKEEQGTLAEEAAKAGMYPMQYISGNLLGITDPVGASQAVREAAQIGPSSAKIVQDAEREEKRRARVPGFDEYKGWGEGPVNIAAILGAGILSDPVAWAPVGRGLTAGALSMFAYGSFDVGRISWEEQGKVDLPFALTVGAIAGAVGGAVGHATAKSAKGSKGGLGSEVVEGLGVRAIRNQMEQRTQTRVPITAEEIKHHMPNDPFAQEDKYGKIADSLNEAFGLDNRTLWELRRPWYLDPTVKKPLPEGDLGLYQHRFAGDPQMADYLTNAYKNFNAKVARETPLDETVSVAKKNAQRKAQGKYSNPEKTKPKMEKPLSSPGAVGKRAKQTQAKVNKIKAKKGKQAEPVVPKKPISEMSLADRMEMVIEEATASIINTGKMMARGAGIRTASKEELEAIKDIKKEFGDLLTPGELLEQQSLREAGVPLAKDAKELQALRRKKEAAEVRSIMNDPGMTKLKNGTYTFKFEGSTIEIVNQDIARLAKMEPLTHAEARAVNRAKTIAQANAVIAKAQRKKIPHPGPKIYPGRLAGKGKWLARINGQDLDVTFATRKEAAEWAANVVEDESTIMGFKWLNDQWASELSPLITPSLREYDEWLGRYSRFRGDMEAKLGAASKKGRKSKPGDLTKSGNTALSQMRQGNRDTRNPRASGARQEPPAPAPTGGRTLDFGPYTSVGGRQGPGRKQRGAASTNMQVTLASTVGGALLGGFFGGDLEGMGYGAAMGLVLGIGAPHIIGKMSPYIGVEGVNDISTTVRQLDNHYVYSRPRAVMYKSNDPVAIEIADKLEIQQIEVARDEGRMLQAFTEAITQSGIVSKHAFVRGLYNAGILTRRDNPYGDLIKGFQDRSYRPQALLKNPGLARVWAAGDKIFEEIAKRAVETGVWSRAQYVEYTTLYRKKGYWPRQWNEGFLATVGGMREWERVWTQAGMRKETAERLVTSITNKKTFDALKDHWTQGSDGLWRLDKVGSKYLRQQRNKVNFKVMGGKADRRSTHLEFDRRLRVDDEKILYPFLMQDPTHSMVTYLNDSLNRIHGAAIWGKNDELFTELHTHLMKDPGNRGAAKAAWDSYYTVQRSMQSDIIKKYRPSDNELFQLGKNVLHRIDQAQLLKLSLGALVQIPQVPVAASMLMSALPKKHSAAYHVLRGLHWYFKRQGEVYQEAIGRSLNPGTFAGRTGAITSAFVMANIAEGTRGGHKILPFATDRWMGPLAWADIFNNPNKFLHLNAFLPLEFMNRSWGALVGRSYAEDLMLLLNDIEMGVIRDPNKIKQIRAAAREFHLNPDIPGLAMPEKMLERAGHKVSSLINHTPQPDTMPMFLQSPEWKFATRFKTFTFYQTVLTKEFMWKPAFPALKRYRDYGHTDDVNLKPLLYYFGVGSAAGVSIDEFRAMLNADDDEFTITERIFDGINRVATLGMHYEIINSLQRTPYGPISFLGGPSLDSFLKFAFDLRNASLEGGEEGEGYNINFSKLIAALHRQLPPYPRKQRHREALLESGRKPRKSGGWFPDLP